MKHIQKGFLPEEIIFSSTTQCNLHCAHCFVSRITRRISIEDAVNFLKNCKGTSIQKIGFTGGEPFLYPDFLTEITKAAVAQDFLFDQIMTNGDWWKNEEDLEAALQKLYDAGYDGKIGLSWDNFHGQKEERITVFVRSVQKIFGQDSINIQTVKNAGGLDTPSNRGQTPITHQNLSKEYIQTLFPEVPVYELPQTFQSSDARGWQAKKWFREDYCQGPGNIFFIHPDGNIVPCCGFANENKELFIGNIHQTYEEIMAQANNNSLVKACFETGLIKEIKKLKKSGIKAPGKTCDICTACDFLCKNSRFSQN